MFATAFVNSLWPMVALRLVTGLTIGAMLASLTSLVSEFFPDRQRNLAVGILLAGYPTGATLGGFLAALLIPEYGWRGVFVAGGAMTLAALPLIYFLLPESPNPRGIPTRHPKNTPVTTRNTLYPMCCHSVK